jgi:hypothetical protein
VRAQLNWQAVIDTAELAAKLGVAASSVEDSLRILGASGLVGFDLAARSEGAEGRYFHRVLPFDLSSVEDMHPRLADARELMARGAVHIAKASPIDAQVTSGGTVHSVRETDGELRCTCPWFAKYQGERGPCKHVLAVEATAASTNATEGDR